MGVVGVHERLDIEATDERSTTSIQIASRRTNQAKPVGKDALQHNPQKRRKDE